MNTTTIVICSALALMALITPLINRFLLRPKDTVQPEESANAPGVSVIIVAHDNAHELKENLPAMLSQDYPAGYEVIVVVDKSTDGTDDVLKLMCGKYSNLYKTFIPESSRYMSRKKLAITIGIKAAKNEWVLLTDAECRPASDQWLKTMARQCAADKNIVIGFSNYSEETSSQYKRFERLHTELHLMRKAQRGTAYRTSCKNLMLRKDDFMKGRGFEGNLKYIRGEYDFIVNKYARKGCTAVETSPLSFLTEDGPTSKEWTNSHLFYMETRKHLMRSKSNRVLPFLDTFFMYLNYALIAAAVAYSHFTKDVFILGAAVLAIIITIALRIAISHRATKPFEAGISCWKIPFFEVVRPWVFLYYIIRYKTANKYDFISHKI